MPKETKVAVSGDEISRMIQEAYRELVEGGPDRKPDDMVAPWKFEPNYPMASLFWRMGGGEDYRHDFHTFFTGLDEAARDAFARKNPEPPGWSGFYISLKD
jgi:hypothetical protein